MAKRIKNPNEICYMCGKSKSQVLHLLEGNYGYVCNECVENAHDMLSEMTEKERKLREHQECIDATPSQNKSYLDQYVIGQDDAKKALSVAVYNHYKRIHQKKKSDIEIEKSNILMIGNTGCGKTFLIKCLAKYLGVPLAIADATSLTEAGYVGDDVENILLKLYEKSECNLEKTQQGIIYIDEIDKLALRGENTSLTRDVSGEGVQQALLKILEGTIARVPFGGGRKHPNAECVNIDTTNILFICGGAFDGLEKLINQDKKVNRTIGFGIGAENISNEEFTLENVQQHDLVRYGMMPEFIGRLPVITTLAPLTENGLETISSVTNQM
jgi:ATP-dependent Clp protease ATP-binding subunit ClpX